MKSRLHSLDNLRTFLIFLVVLHHASLVYQPGFEGVWIVSDPIKSDLIGFVALYGDVFVMFLIFFISGYFMPGSLKKESAVQFLSSKFRRTLLPWIIAVLTLIPAYKAVFLFSRNLPQEAWYTYFHFFRRAGADPYFWSNDPNQQWLWFLPVLFLFQVLYYFMYRAGFLNVPLSLRTALLLVFGIGLLQCLVFTWTELRGWSYTVFLDFQRERLLVYFMVFLLGTLCYKLRIFHTYTRNTRLHRWVMSSLIGVLAVFTAVAINFMMNVVDPSRNVYLISVHVDVVIYYASYLLGMMGISYALLDVFSVRFKRNSPLIDFMNRHSYQVYVVHMIVLGICAVPLMYVPVPALVKLAILVSVAYPLSYAVVYGLGQLTRLNIRTGWGKVEAARR